MFYSELHSRDDFASVGVARAVYDFHTHQCGVWRDSCSCAATAIAANNSRTMSSMSCSIHRIVVVIGKVISVFWKFYATVPEMIC